jgi:hypothetical protein
LKAYIFFCKLHQTSVFKEDLEELFVEDRTNAENGEE